MVANRRDAPSNTGETSDSMPTPTRSRLIRLLILAIVLALSAWYVLRNIDWDRLGESLLAMNGTWVVAGTLATLAAHLVRAWRWRLLIPDGHEISLWNSFSATIIGYFMNNLIPRSGELVRPWALARSQKRTTSEMLATIVVERILDGLTLPLLLLFLLLAQSDRFGQVFSAYSPRSVMLAVILPVAIALVLAGIVLRTAAGDRIVAWIEDRLPRRFHGRLRSMVENFRRGLAAAGSGGGWKIAASTLLIWIGYAGAIACGFVAFDLGTVAGMTASDALSVLAITSIGITIAPTPGAFGVYHFFCKEALTRLYGVPDERAVAFALVTHAAPYLAVTALGAILLVRENISLREVQTSKPR